ncbi:LOG family protein [Lysinimonas soli]|uniref:LOG family protein n=1 Tax=Lysinimonas soli TaxID=1074233 RepID=A0ABW0NMC3_9MICO
MTGQHGAHPSDGATSVERRDPRDGPLPFQPIRGSVYSAEELFAGFSPGRVDSYAETMDFQSYRWFVRTGRSTPVDPYAAMMRALHDSSVTLDVGGVIADRRVVGIMGGHELPRDSAAYRRIAELGRELARRRLLVCTGGGPGAMEAGHLGAALSAQSDDQLTDTIAALAAMPSMPELTRIVGHGGIADGRLVRTAHDWFAPAWELSRAIVDPVESISIPTWHYGHEPTTPFATHIAKLFQNSIREDGLLTIARQGVIFTQGSAGTLHEVFQDAEQNYYATGDAEFSPMVFLDTDYWTNRLPVRQLMDALFAMADPVVRARFDELVLVTDDIHEAVRHVDAVPPPVPRLPTDRAS